MPLTDHSRVITTSLQMFGRVVSIAIESIEDRNSIQMRILPRQQGRPTWRADRIRDKRIDKSSSVVGESVEMRSLIDLGTIRGDRMLGVVVGEDKDDIRSFRSQQSLAGD